jgi:hypothetical protein
MLRSKWYSCVEKTEGGFAKHCKRELRRQLHVHPKDGHETTAMCGGRRGAAARVKLQAWVRFRFGEARFRLTLAARSPNRLFTARSPILPLATNNNFDSILLPRLNLPIV